MVDCVLKPEAVHLALFGQKSMKHRKHVVGQQAGTVDLTTGAVLKKFL